MVTLDHILSFLLFAHLCMLVRDRVEGKVPAVIVFGDSTVDTGNNNRISTILKSNFPPYGRDFEGGRPTGRFSNGRLPSDFISEAFGIKGTVPAYLDPMYGISDFATGVCFASAGTGYDNATSDVLSVMPFWKQLEYYKQYQVRLRDYLGEQEAEEIIREALYFTSIGTNDFLENYFLIPIRRLEFTIDQYQDFLIDIVKNFIKEIYELGARKISLGGLPPMGCLPLERTNNLVGANECIEEYNNVALQFNSKLEGLVMQLNDELLNVTVVFSNPYPILQRIIRRPSLHGFEETSTACCGTGRFELGYLCNRFSPSTCTDAGKYVFWDSFHPTEKTYLILTHYIIKKVLYQFF
ncbi:hypothetical protein Ancab_010848 [Ancistrocladus abbreviatus]